MRRRSTSTPYSFFFRVSRHKDGFHPCSSWHLSRRASLSGDSINTTLCIWSHARQLVLKQYQRGPQDSQLLKAPRAWIALMYPRVGDRVWFIITSQAWIGVVYSSSRNNDFFPPQSMFLMGLAIPELLASSVSHPRSIWKF